MLLRYLKSLIDNSVAELRVDKFTKGDKVRVIDGVFKGAEGHIVRIKKNHRLCVCITGLCAVATGYIPKAFLEKI